MSSFTRKENRQCPVTYNNSTFLESNSKLWFTTSFLRKVPESDARSVVFNTSKLYKVHEQHQRFVLKAFSNFSLPVSFKFVVVLKSSNVRQSRHKHPAFVLVMIFSLVSRCFFDWNAYDFVFVSACFFLLYALVFYVYCRVIPDVLSLMFFHVPPLGFLK